MIRYTCLIEGKWNTSSDLSMCNIVIFKLHQLHDYPIHCCWIYTLFHNEVTNPFLSKKSSDLQTCGIATSLLNERHFMSSSSEPEFITWFRDRNKIVREISEQRCQVRDNKFVRQTSKRKEIFRSDLKPRRGYFGASGGYELSRISHFTRRAISGAFSPGRGIYIS